VRSSNSRVESFFLSMAFKMVSVIKTFNVLGLCKINPAQSNPCHETARRVAETMLQTMERGFDEFMHV
jgi:glycerate kinase